MANQNSSCPISAHCEKFTYFASVAVVALFVVNAGIIMMNRGLQEEIQTVQTDLVEKNNKIQQNTAFANISRSIVQALAAAAITKKDEQIKALLIQNDIKLNPQGDGKQ